MKKILAALLVLALAIPAMADVAITASDAGNQQLLVSFAGPANAVRGVALTLTVTGGTVTNASNFLASDFNTFIDYAFTTGAGYTIGSGHPFALETAAGVAAFPIASGTAFAVSVGYLDQNTTKLGLTAGAVVKIQIDGIAVNGSATVAISANATRGGAAVGDTLGNVTVQPQVTIAGPVPANFTLAMSAGANGSIIDNSGLYAPGTVVELHATANAGFKFLNWSGDVGLVADVNAKDTTITMNANATIVANFVKLTCREMFTGAKLTNYDAFVTAGKDPSCWCWKYQCQGDADNVTSGAPYYYRIYTGDLNKVITNWKKKISTGAEPAADIDHINSGAPYYYQIYTADLNKVTTNWKKKDANLTICAEYIAP